MLRFALEDSGRAAAEAQRGLRRLNEAVDSAKQLQQFAADYRKDIVELGSKSKVEVSLILNTKRFADKLEETALAQLNQVLPMQEQVDLLTKAHFEAKRRLEGVEKIANRIRQEELKTLDQREANEVEDNLAARLSRHTGNNANFERP